MCDFCKIINKEIESHVVYETDKSIAFLDYGPINEGHVLVCPKIHADSITDIPDDTLLDITTVLKKLVNVYKSEYGAKSYSIMQNGGECCDYGHFHMHIFPRYDGDGFGWTDSGIQHEYSDRVAEKIRKALN